MPITVACLLVHGHIDFAPEYVDRLHRMVKRHLDRPFRMVCLTDQPGEMPPGVEAIPVQRPEGCRAWWAKLALFNPAIGFEGRVLYLDLDTLVVGSLAEIADFPAKMALIPDNSPNFRPKQRQTVKLYNSSVMVFDAWYRQEIFRNWKPEIAEYLWGDQDWIGTMCPNEAKMPLEWFPRLSDIVDGRIPAQAKVVLVKKPKNLHAAARWPWFSDLWG